MMSLRVLSYNCGGLRLEQGIKLDISLDSLLAEWDILCLQETWLLKKGLEKLNYLSKNLMLAQQ